MNKWLPPDQHARDLIVSALDRNLLVEAGAGSGKTTAMVQRLVALITTGQATVDQIVAVTFTRKAAAELRERFQESLERAFRTAGPDTEPHQRARAALDNLDSCFLGTIHAFCGRILRERPLEAGVPPDFTEVYGAEEELLRNESWNRFLERVASRQRRDGAGSRLLARLVDAGLAPRQLANLFAQMSDNTDVRFAATSAPMPSDEQLESVRNELNRLLTNALDLMPRNEPDRGWDNLQKRIRSLRFSRTDTRWQTRTDVMNAALEAVYGNKAMIQNRWPVGQRHRELLKDLDVEWNALDDHTHPVRRVTMQWLAHRYGVAIRFARAGAAYYAKQRIARGKLTFQDLLMRTAALLREHPDICRELGDRYRFILIDEFQDTDPIQAEVLFRLTAGTAQQTAEWLRLEPRPGALFVVGDPKQSIYRFRRADISLYLQVKQRFRDFGEVVGLTANFRSTGRIARFVNATFASKFADENEPQLHQATYAPLITHPDRADEGRVAWYQFPSDPGRGWANIARPDSMRIASWIAQRIADGERQPHDFLILTRTKQELTQFANQLERNDVPYEISGAGIGVEEELRELTLLLRALADPGNAVLTLAVLEGMFFGIDHNTLHEHAIAGGHFHLLSKEKSSTIVDDALAQLQRLWELARTETADVSVPLIVEELGILPYAAGAELGATRAGALLFALDVLRQGSLAGRTTLAEAIQLLESALRRSDSEAPLMPGATNVVRVMNLHRAKGLEARVVILANPLELWDRSPDMVQRRRPDGTAEGWFAVFDATSSDRRKPIARPANWDSLEADEREYDKAEEDRLMYVAATRAAEELIIARCDKQDLKSVWQCFHPLLDDSAFASELTLHPVQPRKREALQGDPETFQQTIAQIRTSREAQKTPAFRAASITARFSPEGVGAPRFRRRTPRTMQLTLGLDAPANAELFGYDGNGTPIVQLGIPVEGKPGAAQLSAAADVAEPLPLDRPDARGPEWGDVVHATLHAAARGIESAALRLRARNDLLLSGAPADHTGEPLWLDDLMQLVDAMRGSDLWQRAANAQRVLYEVPFELLLSPDEWKAVSGEVSTASELVSGRIDLAFDEGDGWVIVDYKTDVADARALKARTVQYRKQVDVYAACWERITGGKVKERLIVFTTAAQVVAW